MKINEGKKAWWQEACEWSMRSLSTRGGNEKVPSFSSSSRLTVSSILSFPLLNNFLLVHMLILKNFTFRGVILLEIFLSYLRYNIYSFRTKLNFRMHQKLIEIYYTNSYTFRRHIHYFVAKKEYWLIMWVTRFSCNCNRTSYMDLNDINGTACKRKIVPNVSTSVEHG